MSDFNCLDWRVIMIATGYTSINQKGIHHNLICGCCGEFLGNYDMEDGKEHDDTEGWNFCPYCGSELNKEVDD